MKRHNWRPFALAASVVVVLLSCLLVFRGLSRSPEPPQGGPGLPVFDETPAAEPSVSETPEPPSPEPSVFDTPSAEPSPSAEIISEPVWVIIPAIGTDAELAGTERDEKAGSMAIYPSASVISWYKERPIPGNEGNAILAGHNKWKGEKGAVADLGALEIGDEMTIRYNDGSERLFLLESLFEYELKTAPSGEIMSGDGPARVTVITCSGKFNTKLGTSENRLVAVFKPAEVFVTPEPPITPIPTVAR